MLLTDRFCYIHMPKTGGTFVTAALERLHELPRGSFARRLHRLQNWGEPSTYGELLNVEPKHGTCHDIPPSFAQKPILSCIRGPYEWYVSQFEFGWWTRTVEYDSAEHPTPAGLAIERALPAFIASHSDFPKVTFEEFMQLCTAAAREYNDEADTDFGLYTHSFVQFFYKNPMEVLRKLSADGQGRADEANRFDVLFLRTEHLNRDLQEALGRFGYRKEDLAFIDTMGKVLPLGIGRREDQHWENYYTPDLAASVRERDDPLFNIFPFYDVPIAHDRP